MNQDDILQKFMLIILFVGLGIPLYMFIIKCRGDENWTNYMGQYGQVDTGADYPINNINQPVFYKYNEYRLPYNWPVGVKRSYPVEHIAPFKLGV